mmetsp:Transcript_12864/g.23351  ORF Transcript_12864/g.23351 Transcript_12864/m.23351 type:complete len:216 (-) Transcript_12864:106-753(-)
MDACRASHAPWLRHRRIGVPGSRLPLSLRFPPRLGPQLKNSCWDAFWNTKFMPVTIPVAAAVMASTKMVRLTASPSDGQSINCDSDSTPLLNSMYAFAASLEGAGGVGSAPTASSGEREASSSALGVSSVAVLVCLLSIPKSTGRARAARAPGRARWGAAPPRAAAGCSRALVGLGVIMGPTASHTLHPTSTPTNTETTTCWSAGRPVLLGGNSV